MREWFAVKTGRFATVTLGVVSLIGTFLVPVSTGVSAAEAVDAQSVSARPAVTQAAPAQVRQPVAGRNTARAYQLPPLPDGVDLAAVSQHRVPTTSGGEVTLTLTRLDADRDPRTFRDGTAMPAGYIPTSGIIPFRLELNCSVLDATQGDCLTGGLLTLKFKKPNLLPRYAQGITQVPGLVFASDGHESFEPRQPHGTTFNIAGDDVLTRSLKPIASGEATSYVYEFSVGRQNFYDTVAHNSPFDITAELTANELAEPAKTKVSGVFLTDPITTAIKSSDARRIDQGPGTAVRGKPLVWSVRFSAESGGAWQAGYGEQRPSRVTFTDTLPAGLGCDTVTRVAYSGDREVPRDQWTCTGNTLTIANVVGEQIVYITQLIPADFEKNAAEAFATNKVTLEAQLQNVGTQTAGAQDRVRVIDPALPKIGQLSKSESGSSATVNGRKVYFAEKGQPVVDANGTTAVGGSNYSVFVSTDSTARADFRGWALKIVDNMPCRDGATGTIYKSRAYDGGLCQDPVYNPYRVQISFNSDYAGGTSIPSYDYKALTALVQRPEYAPVAVLTDGTRIPMEYVPATSGSFRYLVPRQYWGQVARIETSSKPLSSDQPAWAARISTVTIYGYADEDLQEGVLLENTAQAQLHDPTEAVTETKLTGPANLTITGGAWEVRKGATKRDSFASEYVVAGDDAFRPKRGRYYQPIFRYMGEPLRSDRTIVVSDLLPEGTNLDYSSTGKLPNGKIFISGVNGAQVAEVAAPEILENFQGTGRTLIRWTIPVRDLMNLPGVEPFVEGEVTRATVTPPALAVDSFNVVLSDPYPDTVPGRYTNEVFLGGTVMNDMKVITHFSPDYFSTLKVITDDLNVDDVVPVQGLGRPDQVLRNTVTTPLKSSGSPGMILRKAVKGEGDASFRRAPALGNASHNGSTVEYEITVLTAGEHGIKDTVIYERVPRAGDKGILLNADRGSTLDATFVAMTHAPREARVEYTTAENPCFPGVAEPAGCVNNADTWTSTVPVNPAKVTALRFTFPDKIPQSSPRSVRFTMSVPPMSTSDAVWNSVAGVTTPGNSNIPLNPIEAPKVGVKRHEITGLNIDKAWVDAAGDPIASADIPARSIDVDVRWKVVNAAGESVAGTVRHAGESKSVPAGGEVLKTVTLNPANSWKAKVDEVLPVLDARGNKVVYSLQEKTVTAGWKPSYGETKELFLRPCGPGPDVDDCNAEFSIALTNQKTKGELRLVKAFDVKYGAPTDNADWILTATGTGQDGPLTFTGNKSLPNADDAFVEVDAGEFSLSERYAGDSALMGAGYELKSLVCVTNGGAPVDVLDARKVTVAAGDKVVCTFTNTDKPGSVSWSKTNPDGKALAGSKWSLTGPNGFTELVAFGEDHDRNSATGAGRFKVDGLPWGEYTLREVVPPPGYEVKEGAAVFVVDGANLNHTLRDADFINHPWRIGGLPLTGAGAQIGLAVLLGGVVVGWLVWTMRRRRSESNA